MATYPTSRHTGAGLSLERLCLPSRKSSSDLPSLASWDELCKSWLSHQNITSNQCSAVYKPVSVSEFFSTASPADIARLKIFAQNRGGPDLTDLRGYSRKTTTFSCSNTMDPSSATSKTKRSATAYGRGFEQNLIDHGVYLDNRAQKPYNIEEIKERLAQPRHRLSPSKFSQKSFDKFQHSAYKAKDEDDIMIDVIPVIHGNQKKYFFARTTKFGNLDPLIAGSPVAPNPDLYYGARPDQLNRNIRDQLNKHIIPSTMEDKPIAPNFFLEVKGPDGLAAVAQRQACYDGAIGARGMLSLQVYGLDKITYDNCASTITSTYYDGMLKMYTTHITSPTGANKSPEYHMTLLGAWALIGSREHFQQGAAAFRNGRDWAKERRDEFISIANKKNERSSLESARYSCPLETEKTCPVKDSESSADKLALPSTSVPYPIEEPQNSADELSITSFSQPNKGKISCNDLALIKGSKPTASKKRPASKISVGASSKDSKIKKVYRGE